MTVKELIEELKNYPQDWVVCIELTLNDDCCGDVDEIYLMDFYEIFDTQ